MTAVSVFTNLRLTALMLNYYLC